MEIGPFRVHAVPRKIMLLHGQIAAFVEIAPDCSGRSKIREEQPQQLKRKLVRHIPATGRSFAGCMQGLCAVRKQDPHQILSSGPKSEIDAQAGVQLNVDISRILLCGAEEKLQAAVLTRLVKYAGIFCADRWFLRVKAHIQPAVIVRKLRVGADLLTGQPQFLVDRLLFRSYSSPVSR